MFTSSALPAFGELRCVKVNLRVARKVMGHEQAVDGVHVAH
jgi:hypothetical protein